MKKAIAALLLLTVAPAPLLAADPPIEARVGKLEKEMNAVQRKVFPGGAQQYFEPEIKPQAAPVEPAGIPASAPIADVSRRVDALETSFSQLTAQVEQNSYKLRQLEDQISRMKADLDARTASPTGGVPVAGAPAASLPYVVPPPPKEAVVSGAVKPPVDAPAVSSGDPGKDAYMAGYDLWTQKKYPEAIAALKAMAAKYPKNRYASYARNLAGRAYLDNGQYNDAIRELFENTKDEAGERAPHSYVFMAQALMKRKPPLPDKACQAYEVLQGKYPDKITGELANLVTRGKADAKCP